MSESRRRSSTRHRSSSRRLSSRIRSYENSEDYINYLNSDDYKNLKKIIKIILAFKKEYLNNKKTKKICNDYNECVKRKNFLIKTLNEANSIIEKQNKTFLKRGIFKDRDIVVITEDGFLDDEYTYFQGTVTEVIVRLILIVEKTMINYTKIPDRRYKPSFSHHKFGRSYTTKRSSKGGSVGKKHNKTRAKRI